MIEEIEKVLESDIRPYLKEHYGDAKLIGFNDGIVQIELMGQCHGCPSAKFTVESVIESKLKEKIPQVKKVNVINMVSDELLDMAKKDIKWQCKASVMKIGIKYCGGCNPRYDRKDIVTRLKNEYKDLIINLINKNEDYDLVIILCGCSSCCINHENLMGKYGKVIVYQDKDYINILNTINSIKKLKV